MVDTNVTFDELFSACAMPEIPKAKQVRVTYNPKPAVTSAAQASYVSAKQILSSRSRKKYSKKSGHTEKNIKAAASRREEQRQKVWWEVVYRVPCRLSVGPGHTKKLFRSRVYRIS